MTFYYPRIIRFQDTDAAGVVYFAAVLSICHEAYEASLAASGICLREFFRHPDVAIPVVHASADFFKPMWCGDRYEVRLTPHGISAHEFAIAYEIYGGIEGDRPFKTAAAQTRHVCIQPAARSRQALPDVMQAWLREWKGDEEQP